MSVSYADIAAAAGVSKMAVSYAFRNNPNVSKATRAKILKIAKDLGYQPDPQLTRLMSHLRKEKETTCREAIGVIWTHPDRSGNPFLTAYRSGIERKATELGFAVDHFNLYDEDLSPERVDSIVHARGIRGLVIAGAIKAGQATMKFEMDWEHHAVVVLGGSFEIPRFHRVNPNHAQGMKTLIEELHARGYRRPGLDLTSIINERTHRLWEGTYLAWYRQFFEGQPPTVQLRDGRPDKKARPKWCARDKVDVVIANHLDDRTTSEEGSKLPTELGLATLDHIPGQNIAGIDQRYETQGEFAVDILTAHLNRYETGEPAIHKEMLVESQFVDGPTLRARCA